MRPLDEHIDGTVALVDGRSRLAAIEMYRQIDYCEIIKGRIRL